jgi:penicillin-binding protein 2
MYATRLKAVVGVLGIGVFLVIAWLADIQILEGSRYRDEAEQRLRRPPGFYPTVRGSIFDRNGVALAQDTGAYDVAVYFPFIEMSDAFVSQMAKRWRLSPQKVRDRVRHMWAELSRLTQIPMEELDRRCGIIAERVDVIRANVFQVHGRSIRVREETYGEQTSIPHPIIYDVDLKAVGVINSRPDEFPGLVVEPTRKREYPHGNVAPHVVGRLGEVTREDLAGRINADYPPGHLRRYWPGDFAGRSGVEAAAEDMLRGSRGMFQKGIEGNFLEDIEPVPGQDIHLTLDIALQGDVEDLLDHAPTAKAAGAAVVLDCRSGEVLALASSPRYDLRTFQEDFARLADDRASPFLNRAVSGLYPMGSTFKAITATAALHEGAITPRTFLTCDGILNAEHANRFRCHIYPSGHGALPLRTAIQKSCNVFFYHTAELLCRTSDGRTDLRVGRDRLQAWAARFGLGRPTGIGMGEAAGRIDVEDPRNLAVGQGELLTTPLQVAQVYGLVATSGKMPPLRLIKDAGPTQEPRDLRLNPQYMSILRDAFAAVVNEPGGTGYAWANLPDIAIAGKTGTAQAGKGEDHAWFVGFAPAENPRIAFSVLVEHGGHGGTAAAPIARDIVRACQAHGYLDGPPAPENSSGKNGGGRLRNARNGSTKPSNGNGATSPEPPAKPPPRPVG